MDEIGNRVGSSKTPPLPTEINGKPVAINKTKLESLHKLQEKFITMVKTFVKIQQPI